MKHKKDRESRKKFKPFRKIPKQVRDDPIYFTVQKLSSNYLSSTCMNWIFIISPLCYFGIWAIKTI